MLRKIRKLLILSTGSVDNSVEKSLSNGKTAVYQASYNKLVIF